MKADSLWFMRYKYELLSVSRQEPTQIDSTELKRKEEILYDSGVGGSWLIPNDDDEVVFYHTMEWDETTNKIRNVTTDFRLENSFDYQLTAAALTCENISCQYLYFFLAFSARNEELFWNLNKKKIAQTGKLI